ncbi:MAG: monofunctional biosynthetic peptidoglycan transglycosylase [Alphaproteobacteria bacterium]|nr:monofunctional biosynthetic peptidoglycan transglycosylase [Alphaproteobacteria bacterium]MDX5368714.1 monofunctional biosynthetic peptidoglycan transglycosylase [Alphaproteobacteria bacterium]MDX5463456.1 monofunctional biosynthetic peptidoglycan transglycosylase [Alphaproteobacteria bacterium]
MPRSKPKTPAKGGGQTGRRPLRDRLRRWGRRILAAFLIAAGLSIAWVALYRIVDPPVTSPMIASHLAGDGAIRQRMALEDLGPRIAWAAIAAEDARFCLHPGFDLEEIGRAIQAWRNGAPLRGASTISQQTAKNAFLWNGRSWVRKGLEVWFTVLIEALWPKERILEVYLNIAEWGPGVYGAEAAARHHFGVSARNLGVGQAAALASILPNPKAWRVDSPSLADRRRTIARGMGDVRLVLGDCLPFARE